MIDMNAYQCDAQRTMSTELTDEQLCWHALFGMASEVGELHAIYQKMYQGHAFDPEHAKKEVGDLLWFVAEYCTAMNWWLGDVAKLNIEKLRARYPDGFDADHSLHRQEDDV